MTGSTDYPLEEWGSEGRVVAELARELLAAEPGERMLDSDQRLRDEVVRLAGGRYPTAAWISPWWEHLEN